MIYLLAVLMTITQLVVTGIAWRVGTIWKSRRNEYHRFHRAAFFLSFPVFDFLFLLFALGAYLALSTLSVFFFVYAGEHVQTMHFLVHSFGNEFFTLLWSILMGFFLGQWMPSILRDRLPAVLQSRIGTVLLSLFCLLILALTVFLLYILYRDSLNVILHP